MNAKFIVFVSYFVINCKISFQYFCKNREIDVLGTVSVTEYDVYDTLSYYFLDLRRNYEINSFIQPIITSLNSLPNVNNQNGTDSPIVFSTFPQQFETDKEELVLPLMAQPVVIIFNLANISQLNLTMKTLADIYKGRIKFWNDIRLVATNPNVKLPNERILPIARQDPHLSTEILTGILSKFDQEWSSNYGMFNSPKFSDENLSISTTWPNNSVFTFGSGTVGIVGMVNSIPYSIGYTTLSGVLQHAGVTASLMHSTTDVPRDPTVENMNQSMVAAIRFSNSNETSDLPILISEGYPMATFSYIVLKSHYGGTTDCCIVQELVGLIHWVLTALDDDVLLSRGYFPLIDDIKSRVEISLTKISCHQGFVYPLYLNSFNTNNSENWHTAIIIVAGLLMLIIVIGLGNFVYEQKFHVDINRWIINSSRTKMLDSSTDERNRERKFDDTASVKSHITAITDHRSFADFNLQEGVAKSLKQFMLPGNLDQSKIYLDTLLCKVPHQWTSHTKRTFAKSMNIVDKNISKLLGVTVINFCPFAVTEYCSKGTLHYVLRTSRYNITDNIKYQFALGIAEGMKYLHSYRIIHGYLSSITCYLDASWTMKICQWEQVSIYQHENPRHIVEHATYETDANFDEARLIELIYVDPDLKSKVSETCDVYSIGHLIVEIFTRKIPYTSQVEDGTESYSNVFKKKFIDNELIRPSLIEIPTELENLVTACLSVIEKRPKMAEIYLYLQKNTKKSGSILEIIMDALEAHNDELEARVNERTEDLKEMNENMQDLLHEVLPAQIAEKLLSGIAVLPEYFECVTIYYSDIAGFTSISAKSSPIEVMTFLNDLWLVFDNVMEKHDVYKVDTIGDAYFVCSGLPTRNGSEHVRQIALLSLSLMENCNKFKVRHLPDEQLKVRIGVHSGPVGAGVVGSKMPQYCIFGDTVNIAVTMESTSIAQRIQISETSYQLLSEKFPNQFELAYRHAATVEGNKQIKTYWLNSAIEEKFAPVPTE